MVKDMVLLATFTTGLVLSRQSKKGQQTYALEIINV